MKTKIEIKRTGQAIETQSFDDLGTAETVANNLRQADNVESVFIIKHRSTPLGKLEIRPIKDIKAGTTVFKSDGLSGVIVHTWRSVSDRIGTRIIWGVSEEETNQDYKENKTFGVDAVDYAKNLAKWETEQENELIAERIEDRASRISLAGSYLKDRQKNVQLEALDIKRPGQRVKRIEDLNAKLQETKKLRAWFHENQYMSGLSSVNSPCYVYTTFDDAIRRIEDAISHLEPVDEVKFKDWNQYIAEMADEVDKWTEKNYISKS